ncbi:HAMP domain-containing sensor histidine kinase [Paenibacillus macerans]|uniref:histidine kinase n=1 Tax=Paenibacillus macerans TaxID=44252 RepID=A0A090XFN4_PAEMA|nr:HAMP domain-containing sensor histidine kinase [Paenibacillus macerans]KFM83738.1 HAMP domain protein [Paenibacillus macerans]MBS5910297.1 HAMP domain-containing histidine kinase [Paenibacillus macerans]MCY7559642.1 HAMP domain-containing histidine kinase [Paenibacillus macerans]MEC0135653.1 HAMP domain-containing sensor histidine kinase [Paenibacillus macerans]MEC0149921.1 HAMP domain-containing sensor histidine kinase [Paenibacillus macerans]
MKLRSKIYLYTSALFAVLLIVVNLSVYILFERMSVGHEIKRVEAEAEAIVKGVRQSAGLIPPDDLLRAYAPLNGMLRIVKSDGTSTPPVTTSSEQQLSKLKYAFEEERKTRRIDVGRTGYVWVSVPVIWPDGEVVNVQVMESIADTEGRLAVLRTVLVAVTLIALIPALVSSRILANRMMTPVSSMIGTMKEIMRSGRFKRLSQSGSSRDELKEMEETFNGMIDMLEANFERQERFVSDASHELKTPLTIIESYASLLRRRGRERPEIFDEAVEAILSESLRMREMTEQLLMLARGPEHWQLKVERVDLAGAAEESVRAFRNAYKRDVSLFAEGPIWQNTDAGMLRQLLFILLDNARKYSETGIAVRVGADEREGWITVEDRGVGIPREELNKVFDRFYRLDPARTRRSGEGGFGLGLALAKEIAGALGVRIKLDSQVGQGTTASLIFRKEQAGE